MMLLKELMGLWPHPHLYVHIYCKIKGISIISLFKNEVLYSYFIGR